MIQVVFEKEQSRDVAMDGSRIAGECVFTEDTADRGWPDGWSTASLLPRRKRA